jgi:hypothetical protein
MEANEEIAENSGDPIKTLSAPDNGADCIQGPGPSYGNEGCIGPAGVVSESCPLGVVLHDEGSKVRKEPEANAVSIMVIKWEERVYKRKLNSTIASAEIKKPTESGRTFMRSEKT